MIANHPPGSDVSPAPPAVVDVDVDIAASDDGITVVVLFLRVVSVGFLVVALTIFDVVVNFVVVGRLRVAVNPIVVVTAAVIRVLVFIVIIEASLGLLPAFRSLRRPCDDNLYNMGRPRLVQREHGEWQWLLGRHCLWLWVQ